ncbi:hypothetical protein HPB49_008394 [Dermacentor silvarum]|uniref:Uncharacterized protein n=1 Tax=Dermacentor silvarum TaxID=543639 RepID=A0ACB8DC74_DERSI|nr:hypothetical protein HPB49_008394 [Dermacentor silvarum]
MWNRFDRVVLTVTGNIGVHALPSETAVQNVFEAVARELFRNDISWGRIVALYSVSGGLAVDCVKLGHPEYVLGLVQALGLFVERDLATWISQQGGWEEANKRLSSILRNSTTTFEWQTPCQEEAFGEQDIRISVIGAATNADRRIACFLSLLKGKSGPLERAREWPYLLVLTSLSTSARNPDGPTFTRPSLSASGGEDPEGGSSNRQEPSSFLVVTGFNTAPNRKHRVAFTRKTKAREQILKLYAYEKKLSVRNRKRQKNTKPVKAKKGTLITRFRRRPQRSILVDFLLIVAGLVLVVVLLYYWLS